MKTPIAAELARAVTRAREGKLPPQLRALTTGAA